MFSTYSEMAYATRFLIADKERRWARALGDTPMAMHLGLNHIKEITIGGMYEQRMR